MIRTRTGYIGLATHAAKAGDYIALFKGARVPFVVRSTPDGWRLVGVLLATVMYMALCMARPGRKLSARLLDSLRFLHSLVLSLRSNCQFSRLLLFHIIKN